MGAQELGAIRGDGDLSARALRPLRARHSRDRLHLPRWSGAGRTFARFRSPPNTFLAAGRSIQRDRAPAGLSSRPFGSPSVRGLHPITGPAGLFHVGRTRPIFGGMAKKPDHPRKPGKPAKSRTSRSGASRPEVQPIGPALAELLNPAINRGESGIGSSTGLQPPPDNSWDRRAGGEAAAHRARASTRSTRDDVAKRDAVTMRAAVLPSPSRAGEGSPEVGGAGATETPPTSYPPPQPSPARGEGVDEHGVQ